MLFIILISFIIINTGFSTTNQLLLSNKIVLVKLLFSTIKLVISSCVNEKKQFYDFLLEILYLISFFCIFISLIVSNNWFLFSTKRTFLNKHSIMLIFLSFNLLTNSVEIKSTLSLIYFLKLIFWIITVFMFDNLIAGIIFSFCEFKNIKLSIKIWL